MNNQLFVIAANSLKDVIRMRDRVERLTGSSNIHTATLDGISAEKAAAILKDHNLVLYIPMARYRITGYSVFPRVGVPEVEFNLQQKLKYQSSEFLAQCPITPGAFNVLRSRWTATHSTIFSK